MFCSNSSSEEHPIRYVIRHSNISVYGRRKRERVLIVERETTNTLTIKSEALILVTKTIEKTGFFKNWIEGWAI